VPGLLRLSRQIPVHLGKQISVFQLMKFLAMVISVITEMTVTMLVVVVLL